MASFAKITLIAYLGKDPESRFLPDGTQVCSFSAAVSEKAKGEERTTWFRVNVWGKQADPCQQYLSKGSQVYVEGRLSLQEYTDRDGGKRSSLEVRASDVQFLGSRGDSQESAPQQARAVTAQSQAAHQARGFGKNDPEGIPF